MTDLEEATDHQAAPCVVELVSGPATPGGVDDFELAHARRALARLKAHLGRQGLLDLLAEDIEEGNAFLREMAGASRGELRSGTTVLSVRGLGAAQFLRWLQGSFDDEAVMLAAEPEHYVIATNADSTVTVVENLGAHVCAIQLPAFGAAMTWTAETVDHLLPESQYPFRRIADMTLPDGTLVGRMLTQFGDTEDGFEAHLTAFFPTACPQDVFEHHCQHLAVEFRNWITAAAAGQR